MKRVLDQISAKYLYSICYLIKQKMKSSLSNQTAIFSLFHTQA